MKELFQKYKFQLISVCSFLFVLLVWQLVTDVFHLVSPVMLPSPTKILNTLWYKLTGGTVPDGSSLFENIWSSLKISEAYGAGDFDLVKKRVSTLFAMCSVLSAVILALLDP